MPTRAIHRYNPFCHRSNTRAATACVSPYARFYRFPPIFSPSRPKLFEAKQACPSSQASMKKKSNGSELRETSSCRPGLSIGTTRFAIRAIPDQLQRVYRHTLDFLPLFLPKYPVSRPPPAPVPCIQACIQKCIPHFFILPARVFNRLPSYFQIVLFTHFPSHLRRL